MPSRQVFKVDIDYDSIKNQLNDFRKMVSEVEDMTSGFAGNKKGKMVHQTPYIESIKKLSSELKSLGKESINLKNFVDYTNKAEASLKGLTKGIEGFYKGNKISGASYERFGKLSKGIISQAELVRNEYQASLPYNEGGRYIGSKWDATGKGRVVGGVTQTRVDARYREGQILSGRRSVVRPMPYSAPEPPAPPSETARSIFNSRYGLDGASAEFDMMYGGRKSKMRPFTKFLDKTTKIPTIMSTLNRQWIDDTPSEVLFAGSVGIHFAKNMFDKVRLDILNSVRTGLSQTVPLESEVALLSNVMGIHHDPASSLGLSGDFANQYNSRFRQRAQDNISRRIIQSSLGYSFSPKDVALAQRYLSQAGFSSFMVQDAMKPMLDYTEVTGNVNTITDTADLVRNLSNKFGFRGQGAIERALNTVYKATQSTALDPISMNQFLNSINASALGANADLIEVLALGGTLRNLGQPAAQAGQSVSGFYRAITNLHRREEQLQRKILPDGLQHSNPLFKMARRRISIAEFPLVQYGIKLEDMTISQKDVDENKYPWLNRNEAGQLKPMTEILDYMLHKTRYKRNIKGDVERDAQGRPVDVSDVEFLSAAKRILGTEQAATTILSYRKSMEGLGYFYESDGDKEGKWIHKHTGSIKSSRDIQELLAGVDGKEIERNLENIRNTFANVTQRYNSAISSLQATFMKTILPTLVSGLEVATTFSKKAVEIVQHQPHATKGTVAGMLASVPVYKGASATIGTLSNALMGLAVYKSFYGRDGAAHARFENKVLPAAIRLGGIVAALPLAVGAGVTTYSREAGMESQLARGVFTGVSAASMMMPFLLGFQKRGWGISPEHQGIIGNGAWNDLFDYNSHSGEYKLKAGVTQKQALSKLGKAKVLQHGTKNNLAPGFFMAGRNYGAYYLAGTVASQGLGMLADYTRSRRFDKLADTYGGVLDTTLLPIDLLSRDVSFTEALSQATGKVFNSAFSVRQFLAGMGSEGEESVRRAFKIMGHDESSTLSLHNYRTKENVKYSLRKERLGDTRYIGNLHSLTGFTMRDGKMVFPGDITSFANVREARNWAGNNKGYGVAVGGRDFEVANVASTALSWGMGGALLAGLVGAKMGASAGILGGPLGVLVGAGVGALAGGATYYFTRPKNFEITKELDLNKQVTTVDGIPIDQGTTAFNFLANRFRPETQNLDPVQRTANATEALNDNMTNFMDGLAQLLTGGGRQITVNQIFQSADRELIKNSAYQLGDILHKKLDKDRRLSLNTSIGALG